VTASTVGVDVGGTKVAAARLDGARLGGSLVRPTQTSDAEELLAQITSMVDEARSPETVGVGIGVPSVVEFATGRVRFSVNIPLADLPLRSLLSERIGLPVFVDNDASCAALAEAYGSDGRLDCGDLVMFTIGTGVGGGVVIGGRVFRGVTGAAPEMGHMIVSLGLDDGAPEPSAQFPQPGSLESLGAGGALAELARRLLEDPEASARDAVAGAQAGDERAIEVLRILGERIGIGIANAINLFDPAEVVIGGGVSAAGDLLLGPAESTARRFVLPGVGTRTEIRLARRGQEAGVLGAALLAAHEVTP
jgi:glucokinase